MLLIRIILFFLTFQLTNIYCARDPPTITLPNQGMIIGIYLKMFRTQRILGYLGIPYALPPIGIRRFSPPIVEDLPKWEGVRNATIMPPDCFQTPKKEMKRHEELFQSLLVSHRYDDENVRSMNEDCLFLNIYIPDGPAPPDGWTTIVWVHSGDFQYGSSSDLDPFQLVIKQKVIVVTIAYRLNIFGFFTTMDGESPGNFGLMDQAAAILWIKRNIQLFGGTEKSITLMGHGAGALSVGFHLTSGPWTEGNFQKAIIMSGSSLSDTAVREAKSYSSAIDKTANAFGCFRTPTTQLIDCLRNVPAKILSDTRPNIEWGPIIDDGLSNSTTPFIPDFPKTLVESGTKLKNVSLLIGFTDMEEALDTSVGVVMDDGISPEMFQSLVEDVVLNDLQELEMNDTCGGNNKIVLDAVNFAYKPFPPITDMSVLRKRYIDFNTERNYVAPSFLLASHMSKNSEVYVYRFDIKPKTPAAINGLPEWVSVPHSFDLIFVWGFPYWSKLPEAAWDDKDKRVTDIIMTLFANFAKFTNPSQVGVYIKWDQFTIQNQSILIIDRSFNMSDSSSIHYPGIKFWNEYYQNVINFASQCCNATNSGNSFLQLQKFNFLYYNFIYFTFIFLLLLYQYID